MNVEISLLALAVVNLLVCLCVGRNTAPAVPANDDMTWLQARADAATQAYRVAEEHALGAWRRGDDDERDFWMRVQDLCTEELGEVAPAMKAVQP